MKKLKLKSFVIPTVFTTLSVIAIIVSLTVTKGEKVEMPTNNNYVSSIILGNELAVMNEKAKIIIPYFENSVIIEKNYYDHKSTSESQEKSITYYDNTYIQNTGVDYVSDTVFDVVSILDGEVTEVKEDNVLGKVIEINHNNKYISIYQSLSEVNVKKGDTISQGQVIGKSGKNELDKEIGNHLHFELLYDGQRVNPTEHLNKEIKD